MRTPTLRAAAIALGLAASIPVPRTAAEPLEMSSVLNMIELWLVANFDLPASAEPPRLVRVPATELVVMRYGSGATVAPGDVVAVYDDARRTIYLTQGWTGGTPAQLSVLVHEMVHHLQRSGNMRFACQGEREVVAYRAQDAWLGMFGTDLENTFGIDAATLLVATVCTH